MHTEVCTYKYSLLVLVFSYQLYSQLACIYSTFPLASNLCYDQLVVPKICISAHASTLIKLGYIRVSGSSGSMMLAWFQPWSMSHHQLLIASRVHMGMAKSISINQMCPSCRRTPCCKYICALYNQLTGTSNLLPQQLPETGPKYVICGQS